MYRGYYYEVETGFYFLNSRYYFPEFHRFINADGIYDTNTGMLSHNMFAYCNNNPINLIDSTGTGPISWLKKVVNGIARWLINGGKDTIGTVKDAVDVIQAQNNGCEAVEMAKEELAIHAENVVNNNSTSIKPKPKNKKHNKLVVEVVANPNNKPSKKAYAQILSFTQYQYNFDIEGLQWNEIPEDVQQGIIDSYSMWDQMTTQGIAVCYGVDLCK